jgi:hypothetical protein
MPKFFVTLGLKIKLIISVTIPNIPTPIMLFIIVTLVRKRESFFLECHILEWSEDAAKLFSIASSPLLKS